MIIKFDGVKYSVDDKHGQALRRAFKSDYARRNGLSLAEAGDFLRERIVPWDKPYAVERVFETPPRGRPEPRASSCPPVGRYDARQVVESMLRRLVKRWLAEGYIEKVGRGTYKLATKAGTDG